ncbi:MAG: hypothetical protein QG622_830, partial [Actinomycetota bacterium]|nr:hypothetical protein [Actinomycetota bacterium]
MTTTDVDPTSSGSGNEARAVPVAIVGLGVTLPGAPDVRSFWNNLVEGTDAVTDVPPRRWDARFYEPKPTGPRRADQISCRRGGFVDEEIAVDLARFGIDPERARTIDPEQLIALHVAAAAIEDAGGAARLGSPGRIGIVLGHGSTVSPGLARLDQRVRTARQLVHVLATLMPSLVHDDLERVRTAFTDELGTPPGPETLVPGTLASRLAGWLGTRGPAYAVDAACASSLIAVDAAVAHLTAGQCDAVVAGGVHHCHDITLWSVFSQLGTLSESQRISPLGAGADGMLLGEGTGMIVLKRLDDALAAGDRVYAVIRGSGVSSGVSGGPDGDGDGGTAGSPGRVEALERAWAVAGLDPRQAGSVGLVEAHGSGVREDDAAE